MKELKFGDKNIRLRWGGVKEYSYECIRIFGSIWRRGPRLR